jgi:uncharacterized membrane protein (DUF373 family)
MLTLLKKFEYCIVVTLVAMLMIAVGRKLVILDYKAITASHMFAMAAILVSLTVSYYLLKRTDREWGRSRRDQGVPSA